MYAFVWLAITKRHKSLLTVMTHARSTNSVISKWCQSIHSTWRYVILHQSWTAITDRPTESHNHRQQRHKCIIPQTLIQTWRHNNSVTAAAYDNAALTWLLIVSLECSNKVDSCVIWVFRPCSVHPLSFSRRRSSCKRRSDDVSAILSHLSARNLFCVCSDSICCCSEHLSTSQLLDLHCHSCHNVLTITIFIKNELIVYFGSQTW